MPDFSVTRVGDDPPVLRLVGDIDLAVAQQLIDAGRQAVAEAAALTLVLDLGGVTFMDSSGLSALVVIHNAARRVGRSATLTSVPPNVQRLLTLSALDALFAPPVHDA